MSQDRPRQEIRFNVVDPEGVVSFVGAAHLAKMLAAGASGSPESHGALLESVRSLDPLAIDAVRSGLMTFDEFVVGDGAGTGPWRERVVDVERAPFRAVDAELRRLSLEPAPLGLVIVNLIDRRIIQIADRYGRIERTDRGRLRVNGRPVARYYEYTLPDSWSILP